MSITDRLADAELLWGHGHREGALLLVLVAVAASAREAYPHLGRGKDRQAFCTFLRAQHDWTISVEFRGAQVDLDELFYEHLRCELVHKAGLPVDLRIDEDFADPHSLTVRAGGTPERTVLLTPAWYHFLAEAVRRAAHQR